MTLLLLALLAAPNAETTQMLLTRAQSALRLGDTAIAMTALEQALTIDPDDVDVLYAAGALARALGRPEAATLLGRVVQLDPYADEARLELALALWQQGDTAGATDAVAQVLERQPDLPEALAIQKQVSGGPMARPSPWRPVGRLDLAAGYDSNLSLISTALPEVSRESVGLGLVDLAVGATYDTTERPFTAFARLTSLQPMNDRSRARQSAATLVGLGVIGRQHLGDMESVLDFRYDEVFTDSFGTHRERLLSPTLYASVPWGERQRLRFLVGGDYRDMVNGPKDPLGAEIEPSSITARAGARDTIVLGRWLLAFDVNGRRAFALEHPPIPGASREVNFLELGAIAYAEARLTNVLGAFADVGAANRSFYGSSRPVEQTYQGELGVRATFDWLELHAEYTYSYNHSSHAEWRWDRQALFAGVRLYAP